MTAPEVVERLSNVKSWEDLTYWFSIIPTGYQIFFVCACIGAVCLIWAFLKATLPLSEN